MFQSLNNDCGYLKLSYLRWPVFFINSLWLPVAKITICHLNLERLWCLLTEWKQDKVLHIMQKFLLKMENNVIISFHDVRIQKYGRNTPWWFYGGHHFLMIALTLKPWYNNAYSPYCSPYISYGTSKENLSKYQDILSLVITSFILLTWMFEQVVIM